MSTAHCTNCGAPRAAADNFCGACGTRFNPAAAAAVPQTGDVDGEPYSDGVTILAILGVVFLPLVALIVALVLRAEERIASRREFLKNVAIGAAIWMALGFVFVLLAFGCAASSGPSQGPY